MLEPGVKVWFEAKDVYLPRVNDLLASLTERVELMGTLVDFSDSGDQRNVFAVVQVAEMQNVILPVSCLHELEAKQ